MKIKKNKMKNRKRLKKNVSKINNNNNNNNSSSSSDDYDTNSRNNHEEEEKSSNYDEILQLAAVAQNENKLRKETNGLKQIMGESV